jgi:hypothetical protein
MGTPNQIDFRRSGPEKEPRRHFVVVLTIADVQSSTRYYINAPFTAILTRNESHELYKH